MISFVVYGEPVPMGYRRGRAHNGKPFMKKRDGAAARIQDVQEAYFRVHGEGMAFTGKEPLGLVVLLVRSRPSSLPKRVKNPVSRPDSKNYLALVEDALNGVAYLDDAQICAHILVKRFGLIPATHVLLGPVEEVIGSMERPGMLVDSLWQNGAKHEN